jgi:hypothetical protein
MEREGREENVVILGVQRRVGDPDANRPVPFDLEVSMVLGDELFLEYFAVS